MTRVFIKLFPMTYVCGRITNISLPSLSVTLMRYIMYNYHQLLEQMKHLSNIKDVLSMTFVSFVFNQN